jgi:DNA polymerase III delta subunit
MKRIYLSQMSKLKPQGKRFLISYQDSDLLKTCCDQIIKAYEIEEIERLEVENVSDWETIYQEQQNYRLFPEPKAFLIDFDKAALNAKQLPQFNFNTDDLYILSTSIFKHPSLDKLIQMNQFEWLGLYSPFNQDLWQYFQHEMQQKGYQLAAEIAIWWQQISLSFVQIEQLLEKLYLNYPNPQLIQLEALETHLGVSQSETVQELVGAWMSLNSNKINHLLNKIKAQDLSLLIWILQRNLIVLDELKTGSSKSQDIFQKHKIWPKQTPSFIQFNQYVSKDIIAQLLCLLQEVDSHFKTHEIAMAMQKLQYLFLYSSALKPI